MDEEFKKKEVWFDKYCHHCEYKDLSEDKDPCHECLSTPGKENSHKPVFFKGNYIYNPDIENNRN